MGDGRAAMPQVIRLNVVETVRKQILLELRTLYQSQSPNIVKFYGAFFTEGQIQICLELMDGTNRGPPARVRVVPPQQTMAHTRTHHGPSRSDPSADGNGDDASGGSLEALVAKVGPFPETVVGCIAGQVSRRRLRLNAGSRKSLSARRPGAREAALMWMPCLPGAPWPGLSAQGPAPAAS